MALLRVGVRAANWQSAIVSAGELLVEAGHVESAYVSEMVAVVEKLGPYIVLVDGVALAHAAPGDLVHNNAISLALLESPVDFGSQKMVQVVFAMAAKDHESHIDSLARLAEVLGDEQTRNILLNAGNTAQIETLLQGILGE
ncbi:MAG: hypothetical protein RIS31_489 [Actinomycetota bacterium]